MFHKAGLNIHYTSACQHHVFNLISVSCPKGEQSEIWTHLNFQPFQKWGNLLLSDQTILKSEQGMEKICPMTTVFVG